MPDHVIMNIKVILLFTALSASSIAFCQDQMASWGVYIRAGLSKNAPPAENVNMALDNPLLSAGTGIYALIPIARKESMSPIKSIKLIATPIALKSGYYDDNGAVIKLDRLLAELDILLPIRLRYSETSEIYCGIGPTVSTTYSNEVLPQTVNPTIDSFQAGFTVELGFLFMGTSTAGLRTARYFGDYPIMDVSVFMGFGFDSIRKGVKSN